eukprot:GEMP01010860.1.p1 GENE.GEMP01010860.1~~GEMP01010860.1.p1  ORF type:complete len:435 (+),score=93.09 GEMP01010860.1:201-1505(+)
MRVFAFSILCTHAHASLARSMESADANPVQSINGSEIAVNVTKTGSALDAIGANETTQESVVSSPNATTPSANGSTIPLLPDHSSAETDAPEGHTTGTATSNTSNETALSKEAPTAEATANPSNVASQSGVAAEVTSTNKSNAVAPNATIGAQLTSAPEQGAQKNGTNGTTASSGSSEPTIGTPSSNRTQPALDHSILCPAVNLLNGHCDEEAATNCECSSGFQKTGLAKCDDKRWMQLPQCHAGNIFDTRNGVLITLNVDLPRKMVDDTKLGGGWDAAMTVVLRNLFGHDTSKIMRVADRTTPKSSSIFFYMEGHVEEASLVSEQTRLSMLLKDLLSLSKPPRVELLAGDNVRYISQASNYLSMPRDMSSDGPSLLPVFIGCVILAILVVVLYCSRSPEARRKYLRNRVQPKVHGRLMDEEEVNDDFEFELMR